MNLLGRDAAALTVVLGMDRSDVDGAVHEITSQLPGTRVVVLPAEAATTSDLVSALAGRATGAQVPPPRDGGADRPRLTAREAEVLELVVSGLTCRQIAGRLVLSRRTVENHVHRMMRKLAVRNRAELVRTVLSRELG
jgi:DNA-binding NarL/FixJ family response regulator